MAQAYAYANAERDYEKLKSGNNVDQSLGIIYKVFELDLSNSSSAQDFRERVRVRLMSMGFSMSEESSISHYRRGIEPFQAEAFVECERIQAEAANKIGFSSILIYVDAVTTTAAAVRVVYSPFYGGNNHIISVSVAGGTIDGKTKFTEDLGGPDVAAYQVLRDGSNAQALVTVQAQGGAATLEIDFNHVPMPREKSLVGDTITIARRVGTPLLPFPLWTPSEVKITALSAPFRWIAVGQEVMSISIGRTVISFELILACQFYNYGVKEFDGFVLRGFDQKIKKVTLQHTAPLEFNVKHTEDEVEVDIRGYSPSGRNFSLNFEFL